MQIQQDKVALHMVASRRGAWIEILKAEQEKAIQKVASRRGAWIEISDENRNRHEEQLVASRRGAWYEKSMNLIPVKVKSDFKEL